MPTWLTGLLTAAGTLIFSLTVTFIFNKMVGIPAAIKKQKTEEKAKEDQRIKENEERDKKIADIQTAIDALPGYREQSLQIQAQLQNTDTEILNALTIIQDSVSTNRELLNERLDRLERREKNAIRAKLLDEYRLFTDEYKNPMLAWSEMEHHAFFELVRDYEDLGGNDYVHSEVIPNVNKLNVIPMNDKHELLKLMSSRRL